MTINIPETIDEIKLKEFQKFDLANKDNADGEFLINKMISIFCDISMKEALGLKLGQAEEIANDITEVLSQEGKFRQTFKFKDKEWGMIPNLTDITLGEYIDLEENLKDTQTLHKAMAVLFRPITKRYKNLYDIEKYEGASKYSESMKDLPVGIATASVVFFYDLSNELLKATPAYLEKLAKESSKTTVQKDSSQENGDGSLQYIHWLKEMLPDLIK